MKASDEIKTSVLVWVEREFDRLGQYQPKHGGASSYLIVLVLMCLALLVRLAVAPLNAGLQYLTFFPAVALSVIIGGLGPGMLAVFIGMCMATFIFEPPYYTISLPVLQAAFWSNMVFLVDGIIVCSAVTAMHRYQNKQGVSIANIDRTRRLIEATQDGFWICDTGGKILDVNDSYCRMSGYTRQELLTMHVHDLVANESREETAAHIGKLIGQGYDIFEVRHRRKNGSLIDLEVSATFSTGHDDLCIAFIRDISARKQHENEIKQSKIELEELYEKAPCGYHSLDHEGRITRINQTEADWLGYTRDELIGRKVTDFHAPSSVEVFAKNFTDFKKNGHVKNIEVTLLNRAGRAFTVLLSATAVYDTEGNYLTNRATMIDITDRKQAGLALADSEEKFRQLFEKAPIGIAMAGQDQKIFTANAAYCKMFGYSLDELRHLSITDLTHPDYVNTTRQLATGVLNAEIPTYSFEKKYLRKDGGTFWGKIIATEIVVRNSQTRYVMGIVEDITERIDHEELRITEVREKRDVLVREVHHRIKNNLQGVVGLLRQHAIDHPEIADVIGVSIGRIHSIAVIHGLQAHTLSEEVDLGDLTKSIVSACATDVAYQNNLQRRVFLSREEAVPVALALNELLTNACKHCSENNPPAIVLEMAGNNTSITITNRFDANQRAAKSSGHGLDLVKSLLPRNSANLTLVRAGDIFTAELKLSPPVTTFNTIEIQ